MIRTYGAITISIFVIAIVLYILFLKKCMKRYKIYSKYILFTIIPAIIFIKFTTEIIEQELSKFDYIVYNQIYSIASYKITNIMKFISNCGSSLVIISIAIISIIILIIHKDKIYWKMLILNLLTSSGMNLALKNTFLRPRPDINRLVAESGYSFPSGHSMISLCFYGYFIYLIINNMNSKFKYFISILLSILILLIGISRIYLGVHYASDVIGGFFAGMSILAISCTLVKYLKENNN